MKKITKIQAVLLVGAVLLGTSPYAFADTATTTSNTQVILTLQTQITDLQAKINALQKAQTDVKASSQDVNTTLRMIGQLRQGMTSDDVALLQKVLASDATVYPEGKITGYYGPMTAKAVIKFQKKHGLEGVGSVGPKTIAAINAILRDAKEKNKEDDDDDKNDGEHGKFIEHCVSLPPGIAKKGEDGSKKQSGKWEKRCWKLPWHVGGGTGTTTPTTTPPVADTTAPVITSVASGSIASTTATVSWTTNESATSKVYYSTTTPVSLATAPVVVNATLTTAHTLGLSGLTASTTYYYIVESKDAANNTATSTQQSFLTLSI